MAPFVDGFPGVQLPSDFPPIHVRVHSPQGSRELSQQAAAWLQERKAVRKLAVRTTQVQADYDYAVMSTVVIYGFWDPELATLFKLTWGGA